MGSELPTDGPFSRLKKTIPREESAERSKQQSDHAPVESRNTAGRQFYEEQKSTVLTDGLSFSYPGIGMLCWTTRGTPSVSS